MRNLLVALLTAALAVGVTASAASAAPVVPPETSAACAGMVPIVVGSDDAAQSDIYSAVTLAGVLGTSCIVLAGPRNGAMPAAQRARLEAARSGGWIVGGTAAVPAAKTAGRDMVRLAGVDRWHTARLVGAVAADPGGDIDELTARTAPVRAEPAGFVYDIEPWPHWVAELQSTAGSPRIESITACPPGWALELVSSKYRCYHPEHDNYNRANAYHSVEGVNPKGVRANYWPHSPPEFVDTDGDGIPEPVLQYQAYLDFQDEIGRLLEECGWWDYENSEYEGCYDPEDTQKVEQIDFDFYGYERDRLSHEDRWMLLERLACWHGWNESPAYSDSGEYQGFRCFHPEHPHVERQY